MAGLHALGVSVRFARQLSYRGKNGLRGAGMGNGSARFSPAEPSLRLPPNNAIRVIATLISSAVCKIGRMICCVVLEPFERRMRRERAFSQMMALNDHQLRDIGLARLDIQAVAMGIYGAPGYEMISPDQATSAKTAEAEGAARRRLRSTVPATAFVPAGTSVPVTAKRRSTCRAAHHRYADTRAAHPRPKTVSVVAAGRRG